MKLRSWNAEFAANALMSKKILLHEQQFAMTALKDI